MGHEDIAGYSVGRTLDNGSFLGYRQSAGGTLAAVLTPAPSGPPSGAAWQAIRNSTRVHRCGADVVFIQELDPLAKDSASESLSVVEGRIQLSASESGNIEQLLRNREFETREVQGSPGRFSHVRILLGKHRKSAAFAAGICAVLVAIGLFSLSLPSASSVGSATALAPEVSTSPKSPSSNIPNPTPTEETSVESPSAEAIKDSANAVERILKSTGNDPLRVQLVEAIDWDRASGLLVRKIAENGPIASVVICAINSAGVPSCRTVIIEGSGPSAKLRQILQPATTSATG